MHPFYNITKKNKYMNFICILCRCKAVLIHYIHYISSLRVKIGAERRRQWTGFKEIDVAKKIKHEYYEPPPIFKNDIALLKLKYAYNNKGTKLNY